jgi:hypothetical protein
MHCAAAVAATFGHGFEIAHERFAIALVPREVGEVDQREREVRRAREFGRKKITPQVSSRNGE